MTGSGRYPVMWVVQGDCYNESSGGAETWIYFTGDDVLLPDLTAPFCYEGSSRERMWGEIRQVARIDAEQCAALEHDGVQVARLVEAPA